MIILYQSYEAYFICVVITMVRQTKLRNAYTRVTLTPTLTRVLELHHGWSFR